MAKKVTGSTALQKYDERFAAMAAQAKTAVSNVGAGGNFISLKGGVMTYQGGMIPEARLRCVVLDAVAENQFYEGSFDPDNFAPPTCWAFNRPFGGDGAIILPKDMAPNADHVVAPVHDTCAGCPNNEWGSADKGKGKACKEVQRLALIPESDLEKNIEGAEIAYMKVPVTSTKGWAGYVRNLDDLYHRPPLAFVTEISVVKENTQKLPGWHLEFKSVMQIEDPKSFDALFERYDEVIRAIAFPYPKGDEAPKNGKKAAGRRR